jgi:hypothetical protein
MAAVLRRLALLPLLLAPVPGWPEQPDAAALLERLHPAAAAEFRYEETRNLELMAAPWQGFGYLLSGTDGALVKLQLSPERVVMVIAGDRMYYYDAARGRRQSAPLSFAGEMAGQIGAFRAILQGLAGELEARYAVAVERRETAWTVRLTEKAAKAGPAIEISGDDGPQRRIVIRQPDGDSTEYRVEKTGEGKHLEATLQRLVAEAAGG